MMLNWIGWILVMYGPFEITVNPDHPIGRWALPRAGGWAYRHHDFGPTDTGSVT